MKNQNPRESSRSPPCPAAEKVPAGILAIHAGILEGTRNQAQQSIRLAGAGHISVNQLISDTEYYLTK